MSLLWDQTGELAVEHHILAEEQAERETGSVSLLEPVTK